ncbi:hypothetical protein BRADI_3g07936v3 [Brachypodium distachyon]|uniref:Uncharacterized protein n=1 Tax=Brachypodium distachyon TaxID=15368 RepID=A0A0Q3HKY6_BRADI|nr:hypothetical protein BRADI_3g07936v3 [Brachypodium distachyon]
MAFWGQIDKCNERTLVLRLGLHTASPADEPTEGLTVHQPLRLWHECASLPSKNRRLLMWTISLPSMPKAWKFVYNE